MKIIYSADRQWYYCVSPEFLPRDWLSTQKTTGPVPEARRHDTWVGWAEYDNGAYHREVRPFVFWEIKSKSEREDIADDDTLALDYLGLPEVRRCLAKNKAKEEP